ncbi:MAG: hypothetical protein DYH12_13340 [Sorangiineae bacterium PRO1]|nr:hypothetical protein [Sorangiineae bacterium PRO1]
MVPNEENQGPEGTPEGDAAEPPVRALRRVRRWMLWALALLPVFLLGAYFLDRARHSERALRGVMLGETHVGGMSAAEVERVAGELGVKLGEHPLRIRVRGAELELEPKKLALRIDAPETARRALALGRGAGFWSELRFWVARWSAPAHLTPAAEVDRSALLASFDEWERRHVDLPFSGGVRVEGGAVVADPPRKGHVIDRERATEELVTALATWPRGMLELPLAEREAFTVAGAVEAAVTRASGLVSEAITLTAEGELSFRFEKDDALRALRSGEPTPAEPRVALGFDAGVVEEKLAPLRAKLEAPPQDARFVVEGQDRVRIDPGKNGTLLSSAKVARALLEAAATPTRSGPLPLDKGAPPEVTTEALEALKITKLVGRFTTHHPCCQPRVDNIHRIADMLRGQVVKPGDSFSVNALVGPRTAKNGFKPAPTIEEGEMVDSLGGGVSQFATTLFNALFLAGYDILERAPHTFWFARYPMGRDATLSWPKPDVAFRNDTEAGALIWTEYGDDHITVKIFGDTGGRKVRFKVSPQQNLVKPPIEYIPDLTQPPEKDKTMEAGQIGWTVFVTREIELGDGTKKEEKRKVVYKPRTRRVIVHPCKVPKGEPGHTGEKCPEPDGGEAPAEPAE